MLRIKDRPQDFFGPDDYMGGDVLADEMRILAAQEKWDEEFNRLPLWRRLVYNIIGV